MDIFTIDTCLWSQEILRYLDPLSCNILRMTCKELSYLPSVNIDKKSSIAVLASKNSYLPLLQWCVQTGSKLSKKIASKATQLDILDWYSNKGGELEDSLFLNCAELGSVEIYKWLVNKGLEHDEIIDIVVERGHFELLKLLPVQEKYNLKLFLMAVSTGNIEIAEWLLGKGCTYNLSPLQVIRANHIPMLEFLHFHGIIPNRIIDKVAHVSVEVIEWCTARGYQPLANILEYIAGKCTKEIFSYFLDRGYKLTSNVSTEVARKGDFELLRWLVEEKNCPVNNLAVDMACGSGNLDIINWLLEKGYQFTDDNSFIYALEQENINVLQLIEEKGFPIDYETAFNHAISNNCLEVLKWLDSKGYRYPNDDAISKCIYTDNVEMLEWLLSKGHTPNTDIFALALDCDCIEIMKWCITKEKKEIMNRDVITLLIYNQLDVIKCGYRNGCIKLPKDACIHAAQSGKIKMLKWVIKHGSVLTNDYVSINK